MYNIHSPKEPWEDYEWLSSFIQKLETNKGLYIKENFENFENEVREKIYCLKEYREEDWSIERQANLISSVWNFKTKA